MADEIRSQAELEGMVHILSSMLADAGLGEKQEFIDLAQAKYRAGEAEIRLLTAMPSQTAVCHHDVSDPGQSPCRCLLPWGHTGPHECGHNIGRFSKQ